MGHLAWVDSPKWLSEELVYEWSIALTSHRASLGDRIELFGLLLFF
jgi:hypothetical protein